METAILEVKINGKWVEWNRITKEKYQWWVSESLDLMKPETRVTFQETEIPMKLGEVANE